MPFCRPTNSVKALKAKNLVQHSTNKSILAADCLHIDCFVVETHEPAMIPLVLAIRIQEVSDLVPSSSTLLAKMASRYA